MSPRRRKQQSWGVVIVLAILAFIAFMLLPSWAQITILIIALIALVEALCQTAFSFSLLAWVWDKIFK